MQEVSLDGVIYARLRHNDQTWLLGSTNPAWKELVGTLPAVPDAEVFANLAEQGLWLGPESRPDNLAVMCCGLGSGWPGMGRDLYDNFPRAREAMDNLAGLAGWDILELMDETDLETISQTRKQIPYLFMLEYAQWMQFVSLGIRPTIMCGHSLGELIALCLAGVYDEKAAWLLFEKRAEHITLIEQKSANETGMLAVHAEEDVIRDTLAKWPSLALANRNTKRQFVLGGPKEDLLAARRSLRKQKIPAMLINVPLAFHNPAMRILRDFSIRRLNALEMHAPGIPVLSNVTTGFYPSDQKNICRYIADLDENAVAWHELALALWNRDHTRIFLELGPAETLCGLVGEIVPQGTAIACDHRQRETLAMRTACARLFSLGLLDFEKIRQEKISRSGLPQDTAASRTMPGASAPMPVVVDAEVAKVLDIVANACGEKAGSIRPEMDLRYDLGMRSSTFPMLLQEVEKQLGISAEFESLLNVSTVGDLALAILGRERQPLAHAHSRMARPATPPFRRFALQKGAFLSTRSSLLRYRPKPVILPGKDDVILFCVHDEAYMPQIWSGFAPEGAILVVPHSMAGKLQDRTETFTLPESPEEYAALPELISKRFGRLDGVVFIPCAHPAPEKGIHHLCPAFTENLERINPDAWIAVMRRFIVGSEGPRNFLGEYAAWLDSVPAKFTGQLRRIFAIADDGKKVAADELGDLTALELMYGNEPVFWCRAPLFEGEGPIPQFFAEAKYFPLAQVEREPRMPARAGLFQGISWWSCFADPAIPNAPDNYGESGEAVPVRESSQLLAMLEGAQRLLPWLVPLGFSDIHFHTAPLVPYGVALECRLECRSMFWIRHENLMTRMVETALKPQKLSANGRKLDEYETSACGICLLGARRVHTQPIFGASADMYMELDADQLSLAAGIDPAKKMVENLWLADNSASAYCGILAPCKTAIAMDEKGVYHISLLQMFDSMIQASRLALASLQAPGQIPVRWKCAGVGYLNFDSNALSIADDLRFYLKPVWRAEKSMRFNAQVGDSAGRIFLVAYNLEFDRA